MDPKMGTCLVCLMCVLQVVQEGPGLRFEQCAVQLELVCVVLNHLLQSRQLWKRIGNQPATLLRFR